MKQIQTNKNPDENPDLPIDFEMFDEKNLQTKVSDFSQMFANSKK